MTYSTLLGTELPSDERFERCGYVGATMFDQLVCRVMFHQMRYEGIFTPPSEQGTLVFPVTRDVRMGRDFR